MTRWSALSHITVSDVLDHWAVDQSGECWVCTRRTYGTYGHATLNGEQVKAHRLMYYVTTQQEPPKGLVVRHTCDNPPCVRPSHLILGTYQDNAQDMVKRGRKYVTFGAENPMSVAGPLRRGDNHWMRRLDSTEYLRVCECGLTTYPGPMGSHVKKHQHKLVG